MKYIQKQFSKQGSIIRYYIVIIFLAGCGEIQNPKLETGKNWPVYLGGKNNSHHSPLIQITRENVQELAMAWEYHTGDADEKGNTQIQCNPIIIDGIMYATSPKLKLLAIDAASGKELWRFDPEVATSFSMNVNRELLTGKMVMISGYYLLQGLIYSLSMPKQDIRCRALGNLAKSR
jgi:hypothetical protein